MKTPLEVIQTLFPVRDALEVIDDINRADFVHTMLIIAEDPAVMRQVLNEMDTEHSTGKSQWRLETELALSRTDYLILISPETWDEDLLHQYLQEMRTLNPYIHVWTFGAWDSYYDDDFIVNAT